MNINALIARRKYLYDDYLSRLGRELHIVNADGKIQIFVIENCNIIKALVVSYDEFIDKKEMIRKLA